MSSSSYLRTPTNFSQHQQPNNNKEQKPRIIQKPQLAKHRGKTCFCSSVLVFLNYLHKLNSKISLLGAIATIPATRKREQNQKTENFLLRQFNSFPSFEKSQQQNFPHLIKTAQLS